MKWILRNGTIGTFGDYMQERGREMKFGEVMDRHYRQIGLGKEGTMNARIKALAAEVNGLGFVKTVYVYEETSSNRAVTMYNVRTMPKTAASSTSGDRLFVGTQTQTIGYLLGILRGRKLALNL